MKRPRYNPKHNKEVLLQKFAAAGLRGLTKGERISGVKFGIIPPIRSERERQLRSRYGLMLEDYEAILQTQNNACAACKNVWDSKEPLYVDHDHKDGHVRGLLCAGCNSIAGLLESTNIIAVWEYLHRDYLRGVDDVRVVSKD